MLAAGREPKAVVSSQKRAGIGPFESPVPLGEGGTQAVEGICLGQGVGGRSGNSISYGGTSVYPASGLE